MTYEEKCNKNTFRVKCGERSSNDKVEHSGSRNFFRGNRYFCWRPFICKMNIEGRILKEIKELQTNPPPGISARPKPDNNRHFDVRLIGPRDTPFEEGIFRLELFLPEGYPISPPKVHFMTKIFHPNIDQIGRVCLDILKSKWSPALKISSLLVSIQSLISEPNPDDPLDTAIAKKWKEDPEGAKKTAREWTALYAMQ
ncbi:Ubiquitin-conjugating enzyme E2 35 [Tritrichomonas foetus]|uniref:Ubiquitin-conjugating enzyme E2 35 n=1 Tax=Tritrichomonas foetus TaxID=1144522 RepID=A0A1J4K2L1_9EUKA|nr:Ubiquitin-conjugating enzyme E2 35 [Tritrichomonas foetus]|eukprot:OHT05040.1 Ubiquitin-conjugating enzyme E2 35 [Tritrichomonas foetus]